VVEGLLRLVDQALPSLGQAHAARGAPHQGHASHALQIGQALAHRGLAHPQARGGGCVAALLGEHAEPVQVAPEGRDFLGIHGWIVHYFEQSIQVWRLVRVQAHP